MITPAISNQGLYFSFQVDGLPDDTFQVIEFTLNEHLSTLFELTLHLASFDAEIEPNEQLYKHGLFSVFVDGEKQRSIKGIISVIERGNSGFRRTHYKIIIRPTIWLLTLNQNSRIFHFQTVPQILQSLLKEHNIKARCQLYDPHQPREFISQKRETNFDFFCRLAAEEGISFWFEEGELVYSDSNLTFSQGPELIYNPHPNQTAKAKILNRMSFIAQAKTSEVIIKDYHYDRPKAPMQFEARQKGQHHTVFDSYARADSSVGQQFVSYRLQALNAQQQLGQGESNVFALMPGLFFILFKHPATKMNRRWQVIGVSHHGKLPQSVEEESTTNDAATLTNQITFIADNINWRPEFIPKPLADGEELATVVGPEGEEIYVNEDGAVRVHFHWNRYDKADDKASCWVRVAQGWNGNNFGFLATPRIGQEVIISYLNGDIDRPIITGTTYNGLNRPPLNLPKEKTRTTFKTKTHKGEGFNELRFEDEAGQEEVYIHAQKDMNTEVNNDRTTWVGNDHTETVDGHQQIIIKKNQNLLVKRNQYETVIMAKLETIGAAKALSIGGGYQITVGGAMNTSVGLAHATEIGLSKTLLVGQDYNTTINQSVNYQVGKNKAEVIRNVSVHNVGDHFELVCGKAKIVLTKDGTIYLKGNSIELQAQSSINGDGSIIQWNGGASKTPPKTPE